MSDATNRAHLLRHLGFDAAAFAGLPDAQKADVELLLTQLTSVQERDPLQFFKPHAKQDEIMQVHTHLRAFLGGNRSGKTTVGIVDDLIQCIDREAVPAQLLSYKRWEPPFYGRIITPDFTSTMEGVVYQKLREWGPKAQFVGESWAKAYDKQNRMLRFKNGSWLQFMTYEQDLDKFGGTALHRVHYDEEPPEAIRKECLMRLIDYGGEELFTMTPLLGMSWMFDVIWEPWENGTLEGAHVVTVDMDDNPYLNETTKHRVLAGLSHEERRARKEGRFVHFGGLIYQDFERDRHVAPQLDPADEPWANHHVYVGIDPGQRVMAAVVFCAVDEAGHMTVFEELALQGATAADVCHEIRKVCAKWKVEPRMYVIDPAARNHMHQTGRSDQMEYADHGIITVLGQNSVTAGINNVRTRLQAQPAALEITANCNVTIDEFRKYRWATPPRTSDADPSEKPIKKDDHLLDALRYVCMARPYKPAVAPPERYSSLQQRLVADQLNYTRKRVKVGTREGGPGRFN